MKGIIDEATITPEDLQQRLKATGLKFIPFNEGSLIVNYQDRMLVLVDINGIHIPFYISTGRGGKEKVESGKWYPTFGIEPGGWINKGDQDSINAYYGNPLLKAVAQKLDSNLGDLRGTGTDVIPTLWFKKNYAIINRDLSPASNKDVAAIWKNINATLNRLGTPMSADPKTVTATPKSDTAQQFTYQSNDDVLLIQIAELSSTVVDPDTGTVTAWNPETVKSLDAYAQKNPTFLKKLPGVKTISLTREQNEMTSDEFSDIEQLDENLRKWFKEKWVRFGPDGKIRGACARGDDSEGKPKCLPQKKAQNLGKKGRKYAASKKRREDPNPERTGKAKNVATKKKTNEGVPFNECPSCRGPIVHESMMNEKQDACYHKVKSRYKVWPSAYASGALVQCRKKGASNWGNSKKTESSIMKGIVNEEEYVLVLYIDGKPSTKYGIDQEAKKEMERLKAKFPNRKFELKREIRGGISGHEKVGEAANPAQQAAIAINMKKRGEKPKNEASGTPGGVERFRSPAMVDLAMQQNLYKKDLEAVKKAQQADKPKPEYRRRGPAASGEEHSLRIASTAIPTELVKDWIENKSVSTVVDFMSRRFANRQSTEMIDEIKADPRFSNAVSKFFDIAGKSLEFRIKVKAANTTVNDSRFKVEAEDLRLSGFEAWRGITDVVVDYMKKYGVDKTGRRVPPGFNYALGEGVIIGHDKDDPQIAVLGGAGSYKLSNLKKKALGEAKQLAADIANGEYKNSAYNVKQLANTLNTIVAAEEEMEKLYFGEDYTDEFAAEVTPPTNPYGGLEDRKFRGAIGEAELDEACWKGYHKEGNKKMFGKTYPNYVKNTNEEEQLDELSPELLGRAADKAGKISKDLDDKSWAETPFKSGIVYSFEYRGIHGLERFTISAPWDVTANIGAYGERKLFADTEITAKYPNGVTKTGTIKDFPDLVTAMKHYEGGRAYNDKSTKFSTGAANAASRAQAKSSVSDMGMSPAMKRKLGIEEEQLDEKCWDTHKQVGMKNKGGRQVPNCVPKESAIMKGLKSL